MARSRLVFRLWHLFREGTIDRATRQAAMAPIQAAVHGLLAQGARRCAAPEALCQEWLARADARGTFVCEERVEPPNNAAEPALRPTVIWRKGCFGAHSADGNRFVERILTVSATCRKQERHLRTFVTEAIEAYWAGRPAPTLLPTSISPPRERLRFCTCFRAGGARRRHNRFKRTGEVGEITLKRKNVGKGKERIAIYLHE